MQVDLNKQLWQSFNDTRIANSKWDGTNKSPEGLVEKCRCVFSECRVCTCEMWQGVIGWRHCFCKGRGYCCYMSVIYSIWFSIVSIVGSCSDMLVCWKLGHLRLRFNSPFSIDGTQFQFPLSHYISVYAKCDGSSQCILYSYIRKYSRPELACRPIGGTQQQIKQFSNDIVTQRSKWLEKYVCNIHSCRLEWAIQRLVGNN